jgi:AraC-like DNA-binding protein
MDWTGRLNSAVSRLPLGNGRVEVLTFAYDPRLVSNQPHRHTFFEACLVGASGLGEFRNLGNTYRLLPGTLFLARPGAMHQIRVDPVVPMDLSWISFTWAGDPDGTRTDAERLMRAFSASDVVIIPRDDRVSALWRALRAASEAPSSLGFREQASAISTALIMAIAQALTPTSGTEPAFDHENHAARLAIRFIQDNLNRPVTVPEIASHAYVSERQLLRLFARFTGESPARYALLARLDRAAALLKDNETPVREVAQECGFSDAAHFNRVFVRRFGVTPGAYRHGARGEGPLVVGALV